MKEMDEILKLFPLSLRKLLGEMDFGKLQEIRLRAFGPLLLQYEGQEWFVSRERGLTAVKEMTGVTDAYIVEPREIRETLEAVGRYSLYAYEEELRQGFLTIQGGHRIGVAGKTVLEGDKVRNMKNISFLNVRLSHQIKGCGDSALPFLYREDGQLCHTLIVSPPRCGKTTLLRDLIRQISDGSRGHPGHTVGVVDERSEIAGCYQGIPGNDVGIRTDVLDCCPKAEGMMMLIRSMSPQVVAVDEIGGLEDIHSIEAVLHCGCRLLATVHGSSMEDMQRKPLLKQLVQDRVFERYIILQNQERIGQIRQILDEKGQVLYGAGRGGRIC